MHQHDPEVEDEVANVENLLDAQLAFSPENQPLLRCSDFMSPWQILRDHNVSWRPSTMVDTLPIEPDSPDVDKFHAKNERVYRRPFSHSFLRNAAGEILAMEAGGVFLLLCYVMFYCKPVTFPILRLLRPWTASDCPRTTKFLKWGSFIEKLTILFDAGSAPALSPKL